MIYKHFGPVDISQFAFGAMRLPKIGDADGDIDIPQTREMIKYALENGVNYFDTAYGYHDGKSESVVGTILHEFDRDSFYLATKFPGYDKKFWSNVKTIFPEQLSRCQVEHFDFYLCHNVCELNIEAYLDDAKYGIVTYLREQRRNGKIKHLGFSTHGAKETFDKFLDAYGEYMEFCQIQLNWLDWDFQDAKYKVKRLNDMNIPIWVMEPLRGGKLLEIPDNLKARLKEIHPDWSMVDWCMRYLQGIKGVTTILSGSSNMEQLKDTIRIFQTDEPLNEEEVNALKSVAKELTDDSVPCTACSYCTGYCPQELNIPSLIALYNQRVLTGSGDFVAPMALRALPEDKKPSACIGCRSCEEVCPQKIPIADVMSDFAKLMAAK